MYNTRLHSRKSSTEFQARLVLGATAFFAIFRLFLPIGDIRLAIASLALDVLVFLAIFLLAGLLAFTGRFRDWIFHLAFLLTFTLTFASYFFFREATIRQYSLFDLSVGSVLYFFTDVLPTSGLLFLVVGLAAIYLLHRWLPSLGYAGTLLVACAIAPLTFLSADPRTSLVAHVVSDIQEAAHAENVSPTVERAPFAVQEMNVWERDTPTFRPKYKKILVFVMEQITLSLLMQDSADLPGSTFVNRSRKHAHEYTNVFAADMDSRTGLLALLGGRLIPFEAYTDADVGRYKFLANKSSILTIMHAAGYKSAFSASETEHEAVVYDLPWTERFTLSSEEIPAAEKEYICLNPYEFEHSCEDKVLIDRLARFISGNEKAFLFHEFIFGHASEYLDATNKTSVQYYSEFLDDLTERLERDRLLNDTLIVLTSDHGIRDKGYEPWVSTYRIPMWFIHPSFKNASNENLYSQIDFRDLLLAEASIKRPNIPARKFAPFMGMTSSSLVGAVTREQDVLVVKNRRWRPYVLFHLNSAEPDKPGGPPVGDLKAPVLLRYLDDYRSYFLSPALK
ncbi:MAG: sulfatase-like hydrolase/transferase [Leptospirales bacterium]|nr:sulfatase-like hydrolase/transferase [Leptospirales bacterium]